MASVNPHAPRVGGIRRLIGPFHVTGVFWYWLPNLAPRCFPRWAFNPAERFFGFAFYFFLVNIRRAVRANLRVVLGPCSFWEGQRLIGATEIAAIVPELPDALAHLPPHVLIAAELEVV